LISEARGSIDATPDIRKNKAVSLTMLNRNQQRSATSNKFEIKARKFSAAAQSKISNDPGDPGLPAQENAVDTERRIVKRNPLRKASTGVMFEKITRAKTARQIAFNPDDYEETYDATKLMQRVQRMNRKLKTFRGQSQLKFNSTTSIDKRASISSSSSLAISDSNSDSMSESNKDEKPPSNRASANQIAEEVQISRNKTLGEIGKELRNSKTNVGAKDNEFPISPRINIQDPLASKEAKGTIAETGAYSRTIDYGNELDESRITPVILAVVDSI